MKLEDAQDGSFPIRWGDIKKLGQTVPEAERMDHAECAREYGISIGQEYVISSDTVFMVCPSRMTYIGENVVIGNNVKVGSGVTMLPGVHIGDNSIIEAGCVISEDVPYYSVVIARPRRLKDKGIIVDEIDF